METKYGVEYLVNDSEGTHWQELDPIDFIRLVQKYPEFNVDYCYESKTFTFWDEYGVYYRP